jgi:hypothetical protein
MRRSRVDVTWQTNKACAGQDQIYLQPVKMVVYLQLNKKKAKAEGKKCHAKTMCQDPDFFSFPL